VRAIPRVIARGEEKKSTDLSVSEADSPEGGGGKGLAAVVAVVVVVAVGGGGSGLLGLLRFLAVLEHTGLPGGEGNLGLEWRREDRE